MHGRRFDGYQTAGAIARFWNQSKVETAIPRRHSPDEGLKWQLLNSAFMRS